MIEAFRCVSGAVAGGAYIPTMRRGCRVSTARRGICGADYRIPCRLSGKIAMDTAFWLKVNGRESRRPDGLGRRQTEHNDADHRPQRATPKSRRFDSSSDRRKGPLPATTFSPGPRIPAAAKPYAAEIARVPPALSVFIGHGFRPVAGRARLVGEFSACRGGGRPASHGKSFGMTAVRAGMLDLSVKGA